LFIPAKVGFEQVTYDCSGLPANWIAFLCIAVKAGLEKRRYLHFSSASAEKCLVSATFFTERERPAATAVHKKAHLFQHGFCRHH
jgi:hypothetical protein